MLKPVVGTARREPCTKCGLPVVIAERLHVNNQLYHRTCFTCILCTAQLTLANYCETEGQNQFCCETCPDEEFVVCSISRSLSDEEKSASIKKVEESEDFYSDIFETAVEDLKDYNLDSKNSNAFILARSRFVTSQLDNSDDEVPSLPESALPATTINEPPDLLKFIKNSEDLDLVDHLKDNISISDSVSPNSSSLDCIIINSSADLSDSDKNQLKTANNLLDNITKESVADRIKEDSAVIEDTSNNRDNKHDEQKCEENSTTSLANDALYILTDKDESVNNETIITISSDDSTKDSSEYVDNIEEEKIQKEEATQNAATEKDYPDDLNPFDDNEDDEDDNDVSPKVSLNPFDDDEDEETVENIAPAPTIRKKILLPEDLSRIGPYLYMERYSYNPYEKEVQQPTVQTRKFLKAPKISLDYDDVNKNIERNESGQETGQPVPLPRKERPLLGTPNPTPRKFGLECSSVFGSNTSLSSTYSSIEPGRRKKKQAPKPPTVNLGAQESAQSSLTSTPCTSAQHSPKLPRSRKSKKAPPPPTSTPFDSKKETLRISTSPIFFDDLETKTSMNNSEIEKEKVIKDELNRNRQSQMITDNPLSIQAIYGKQRRSKGPAPSLPVAEKRSVKPLPLQEIKHELDIIEIQMQGLEKQGLRLEELIRDKCEGPDSEENDPISPEVDNLILELFEIVNEKNGLFRRQAELMYFRRQQRLEEEHADLEYQIRCLILVPEPNKTDSDKAREEELIKRLYEVVEQRNEIIECLEMDRVREVEEDDSIKNQLTAYSPKCTIVEESVTKKKKKFKLKSSKKVDADKDIDESETSPLKKEKKKKKFNIF